MKLTILIFLILAGPLMLYFMRKHDEDDNLAGVRLGDEEPSLAICSDCHDLLNEKGECDYCSSLSPCCGSAFDKDYRICPSCKEHV